MDPDPVFRTGSKSRVLKPGSETMAYGVRNLFFSSICDVDLPMVLIVDGNSELGAHVMSNLFYLNCYSRHLIRLESSQKSTFITIMRTQHVLSYHLMHRTKELSDAQFLYQLRINVNYYGG